ncbi:2-(1,2-epoxy-1,2-dihydrophenyl)acetyl-CoA isomerase [Allopusillimonas soli]|uniref:2-(1,2-epoxy-1,2-dihydrophenyl)acetyl-CoA isomerase n=1 Tax=Allopusillimonas soli TaxID=659016 RepID=A0A853F699_9BURK|nr:enoyl-CoA hydratase-related protein [Allopusillimonas soli]NYT35487.1 2-(1,2-epoxy-1,2-dihydrophenyl)acetyl-CoA isomerase [Allopusillimonas soli]TEA75899.1 2-(1,2-epoxy-1,2-dihydrophenyl)acetyl-CoA isomerase [Allopusillimonas soli]
MGHTYQHIKFTFEDGVGCIVLNRPDTLNSFTQVMHEDIRAALDFMEAQEGLRGLIITGTGRGFCAGQDLSERKPLAAGERRDLSQGLESNYKPLVLRLRALPVPVVCIVNGVAAGAGASVALACDVVYAVRSARFIQAFARIGLLPDAGATYVWPRRVGTQRAMGAALFAEPVSAEQAEQWGLIWRCVPDEELDSTIAAVQARLAGGATRAWAATKQALYASGGNSLEAQLNLERDLQKELGYTEDYLEGMKAFAEKRPARFTGR